VSVQFISTSFDPHINSQQDGAGITRLTFLSPIDGSPLSIAFATDPLFIYIPASDQPDDQQRGAACTTWDAKAKAYSCAPCAFVFCRFCAESLVAYY
jgi:hypothetical protein